MFNRSLPPRFWLLVGCVVLPLINAVNASLIEYFSSRFQQSFMDVAVNFIIFNMLSLIVNFPLALLSTIASERWKSGSHRAARWLCFGSGLISSLLFSYFLWFSWQKRAIHVADLSYLSQFPLPLFWSLGLILTSFLLRTPRRS